MGFRQFSLRGLRQVQGEWSLVCLAWNIKRMAVLRLYGRKMKKRSKNRAIMGKITKKGVFKKSWAKMGDSRELSPTGC